MRISFAAASALPFALALAVSLSLAGCCGVPGFSSCSSGPPPPDSCKNGEKGTLDSIELGSAGDLFTAYHDGDAPEIVEGGQGATMMGIRLRLRGSDVPACLSQLTSYAGGASGHSDAPLKTYAESDGSFTTKPEWIPGSFPSQFDIVTTVGTATGRVHLGLESSDGL